MQANEDRIVRASIGQSVIRRDALVKASGFATYAADVRHADVAYATLVLGTVAKGRVVTIDASEAEATPGVRLVLTHRSLNQGMGDETFIMKGGHMQSSFMPLSSDVIHYAGQIVGLVVADTTEIAEEAGRLVRVTVLAEDASASMDDPGRMERTAPAKAIVKGNADAALAVAPVSVDHRYRTPAQHHDPIELYATTAAWHGDTLSVDVPSQWVIGTRVGLAAIFGIPPEDVHVESQYVGGGFGSKATILPFTVLAATAAKRLGRPVKLVVPREAMFSVGSFRPATRTRVALGAERDGTLTSIIFEEAAQSAEIDDVAFPGSPVVARMYESATLRTGQSTVATDVNTPGFQRAPAEASSFFGFESAVDELAVALNMDPIALRLMNEPAVDPVTGVQWSSRSLVRCYRRGAEIFGWDERNLTPGSARTPDGLLKGLGCATASYPSFMRPASARVTLHADGMLLVASAAHELGQGAYTVLGQIAADVLGVANERVRVNLGASDLPAGPMAGGSLTTGAVGSAVHLASRAVRDRLLAGAVTPGAPFAGVEPTSLMLAGGCVIDPEGRSREIATVLDHLGQDIEETVEWKPDGMDIKAMRFGLAGGMATNGPVTATHASYSFGAQFAEVHVDPLVRTIRVARMVGVFACGKIINPRTAHSNLAGGMIWGASFALLEESRIDRQRASFTNTDLAGYHFASNADIGEVLVETIDEEDLAINAVGAKSVGEVGIVGMPAAIANAVYNATGIRVRKTPILMEDLL